VKRITIAISEDIFRALVDFAAEQSKLQIRRYSVGEVIRGIIQDYISTRKKVIG